MAMRATYVPDPAAPRTTGIVRLEVTIRSGADTGELVVYRTGRPPGRTVLTATQIHGVLELWVAAARAGLGELLIGN